MMNRPDVIQATLEQGVFTIRLQRVRQANALNSEMYDELSKLILYAKENASVNAVVLTAEGKFFSAGADVKEFSDLPASDAALLRRGKLLKALCELVLFNKPLISALQGPAIGGGFMLALACDEIIIANDAWVSMPESTFGMPSPIGIELLKQRTDRRHLHSLIQWGEKLLPEDALRCGVASGVCSKEEIDQVSHLAASRYSESNLAAYAANKMWLNHGLVERFKQAAEFATSGFLKSN